MLDASVTFSKIFEGNGFTVSNFTVEKAGTAKTPTCSIFDELSATAVIRNVSFENVSYDFTDLKASTDKVTVEPQFAALTLTMQKGAKIESVSVSGTVTTNSPENFASLESVYWYAEAPDADLESDIKDFTASITVVKQS